MGSLFVVRKCVNPACGLRYTLAAEDGRAERCPVCRSQAELIGDVFGQLEVPVIPSPSGGPRVEVLLDNIRSAWNVGSMLRAADGAGVGRVHLCGVSPSPDLAKVAKTALGAEFAVPWQRHMDGVVVCRELLAAGYRLWALEGGDRAENLFQVGIPVDRPLLLVVGNELTGIDPGILALCERVVCLPMLGSKGSLNVAGAFTTAVYTLRFAGQTR
jgi:23S rRNA (guanosine2251-2'-O)-methyltransferase